jgi:Cu+-exporting ATPase
VVLWGARPFFVRAASSLVHKSLNMFTLIGLGVGVAYGFSLLAVLAPGLFPAAFRDADGGVPVYFESAAVITALVLLGQVLELKARGETSAAIRRLLELAPATARRVRPDGGEEDVPLSEIATGDLLRVRPGEKVYSKPYVTPNHTATPEKVPLTVVAAGRVTATNAPVSCRTHTNVPCDPFVAME